jgi:hypothetical protein
MSDLCRLIWYGLIGRFRSRAALEAEILVLRHQLNVLRRKSPNRLAFSNIDRLVFTGLYRLSPNVLDGLKIPGQRPSSAGTAPVSGGIGAGNHARSTAGPQRRLQFASSFVK